MILSYLWLLFVLILGVESSSTCNYCQSYNQSVSSNDLLKEFCKHGNLNGRCCWEGNINYRVSIYYYTINQVTRNMLDVEKRISLEIYLGL